MGLDVIILDIFMLSFKPAISLSTFTLKKKFFSICVYICIYYIILLWFLLYVFIKYDIH